MSGIATALAQTHGCSYVCNPSHWETSGHSTGNVGFMFGCISETSVRGSEQYIASKESVKDFPVVKSSIRMKGKMVRDPGRDTEGTVTFYRGAQFYLAEFDDMRKGPVVYRAAFRGGASRALSARRLLPRQLSERRRGKGKDSPAYKAKMKEDGGEKSTASGRGRGEGVQIYDFVHSAPWLRHQYNDLRRADDRRTPLWKDAQWRIVLYFRRGDRGTAGELSIDLSREQPPRSVPGREVFSSLGLCRASCRASCAGDD